MAENTNRKALARKTSIINLAARIITMVVQFVTRKMLIQYLGVEYLGLNSTLAQLLGTLSVSELGIQAVIIFKLYKPLAEDDKDGINKIMSVYRSLYRYVFLFISAGSIVMIPFLKLFITKVEIPFWVIVLSWLIMAATTAVSYLLSYNYAIITADQKLYLITCVESVLRVVFGGLSILALLLARDYFVFLAINLLCTVSVNISYYILRKRYYPWLTLSKPEKGDYKDILITVKDGFSGKLSAYIFNSTDNIVISAFLGTALVGMFGNYSTIVVSMTLIMSSLINPIQAIIGNYLVKANKDQLPGFVINYTYVVYLICSVLFIPTFLLVDDFVCLFYGSKFKITPVIVILMAIDKYISFALISVCSILDAAGQFKVQKKMYFIGAMLNIGLSLIGVAVIGLPGILIGTIIGHLYYWWTGYNKCYTEVIAADRDAKLGYIKYSVKLTVIYSLISVGLYLLFHYLRLEYSIVNFLIKGAAAVGCIAITHLLIFGRTKEFANVFQILGINKLLKK